MRLSAAASSLLLALLAGTAYATVAGAPDAPPRPRAALQGADCLDAARMRSWHFVDSTQLLVDAGRRKYRISLAESCTALGSAASISFSGDRVSGRVCGNFGERVLAGRMACRIDRVELLDDEAFREAASTARRRISAGTTRR
jgi:hypothetical protein